MNRLACSLVALAAVAAVTILSLGSSTAWARKPEDVFGGKVMLSDKPFPTTARSPSAYVGTVKKQSKDRFVEDKEKQQWRVFYAAFFKKPINDLEVTVKLFDITGGAQRLVESYEQFLTERGQRVVTGNVKLKKGEGGYDPNTKIRVVIESKGRTVAQAQFMILGEGRKFTGKVEFSEDEVKQKGEIKE